MCLSDDPCHGAKHQNFTKLPHTPLSYDVEDQGDPADPEYCSLSVWSGCDNINYVEKVPTKKFLSVLTKPKILSSLSV